MNLTSKHEIIEDEEINVDDDDPYDNKSFIAKSDTLHDKFSFSITNILSDNFGPKPMKIEQTSNDTKTIFRPFEMKNFISNNNTTNGKSNIQKSSSVFLSNFRLSEIFDYSTKNSSPHQNKSDTNSLRNSLYNSLTSYPKIQEEILNSRRNALQQPLGSLSKTIQNFTQSPVTRVEVKEPKEEPMKVDSFKMQHTSTDSIDSDDCKSEASASKDESQNQMWPAWVSVSSLIPPVFALN
jgi:hypothetical protein